MKTFIALTLIGILSYAYAAQLVPIDKCKVVTPMDNFSATKLFNGMWYVTHVQKETSKTVCQTFKNSKTSDSKYITEFEYDEHGNPNKIHCEASREPVEKKLSFNCKKNGEHVFQSNFIVLDTDYNDYAVFYRCVTLKSGVKADNFVVIRRDPNKEEIPEKAKPFTNSLNLLKCSDFKKV
uniref:Pc41, similar to lipocalin-like TiLipo37 n=1 Tax=Panstrongylus chinai TaxID=156444 RepID=A0A286T691_9HEMI|nr:Pc41, similar to lipocalin-like TiLipo37 [Panstrongylus chinai]